MFSPLQLSCQLLCWSLLFFSSCSLMTQRLVAFEVPFLCHWPCWVTIWNGLTCSGVTSSWFEEESWWAPSLFIIYLNSKILRLIGGAGSSRLGGNRPVSDRKDKKIFNCQDFRILGPYSSFFKAHHGVIWGNNRRRFCSVSKAMSYIVKILTGLDNIQLSAALLYLHWKGMYMPTSNS